MTIESLTRDDFATYTGTGFAIRNTERVLVLERVSPVEVSGPWETFALLFRGPVDAALGQGSYLLDHDRLGELEMFLVPMQPDDRGPSYEAVFSRAARAATEGG